MPYCVAAALTDGDVTMDSFTDERINDPALRALVGRISMHRDAELTRGYPEGIPNRIRVRLRDGREVSEQVSFPRGHARNPMIDEEVAHKYSSLVKDRLEHSTIEKILNRVMKLENVKSMNELVSLLQR